MTIGGGDISKGKPSVLWLHPIPEHYLNCMLDDLAGTSDLQYSVAFGGGGPGWYKELPVPQVAPAIHLRVRPGFGSGEPPFWARQHENWKADLQRISYDVAIVAGYGSRTSREFIHDCRSRGIPLAMFSDSNMRSERSPTLKARIKRVVKRTLLRRIIREVDILLVANRLGVEYWKFYGAPSEKIVVCPYYADYQRVALAARTNRNEVFGRQNLNPDHERLIFTAARLVPAKGLDLAIKAFRTSRLAERGYRYLIAGVGPLEAELKQLAGDALGQSIRFIGFQQPSENLALMHHADVFLLPSIYEPHGIVVQESLAAGTPVIASDVCGAAYDLVEPGVNGEIFRSGDWPDLQAKLAGLLADAPRLAQMRVAARAGFERWFAEYSPIKVVDRVAHQLLAKKHPAGR